MRSSTWRAALGLGVATPTPRAAISACSARPSQRQAAAGQRGDGQLRHAVAQVHQQRVVDSGRLAAALASQLVEQAQHLLQLLLSRLGEIELAPHAVFEAVGLPQQLEAGLRAVGHADHGVALERRLGGVPPVLPALFVQELDQMALQVLVHDAALAAGPQGQLDERGRIVRGHLAQLVRHVQKHGAEIVGRTRRQFQHAVGTVLGAAVLEDQRQLTGARFDLLEPCPAPGTSGPARTSPAAAARTGRRTSAPRPVWVRGRAAGPAGPAAPRTRGIGSGRAGAPV